MNSFKNLPSGWKKYELKDIVEISSKKFNPLKDSAVKKCIELEHLSQDTGQILGFVNSSEQKSIKNEFQKGQILFGKLRPYLKKFYKAEFDGVCSSEIWVLQGKKVSNDFLLYLIQTNKFVQIANTTSGTKMPRADWEFMSENLFCIPPLKEQEKIAEILSTWDRAINLTAELIKSKKEFKKGLVQNLLTTKIRFPNFNDKWQETKLGEIVEINSYASKSKFIEPNGKYLIVDMGAVSQNGQLVTKKRTNINQDMLYKNDLVMPKDDIGGGNIIGKVARIDKNDKYICGDHVYKITTQQNAKFLYFIINSQEVNKQMRSVSTGTAQLGLAKRDVKNIKIKLPNLKEQQKIAEILIACDDEIKILENKLEKLKRQKQGLMQNLLTGKVRV